MCVFSILVRYEAFDLLLKNNTTKNQGLPSTEIKLNSGKML